MAKTYWQKRAEQNLARAEKISSQAEVKVANAYNEAVRKMKKELPEVIRKVKKEFSLADIKRGQAGKSIGSEIDKRIDYIAEVQQKATYSALSEGYVSSYQRTAQDLQKYGLERVSSEVQKRSVERAVNDKWLSKKNYSDRVWDDKKALRAALKSDVTTGIIRGTDPKKIAEQVAQKTGVTVGSATRLVRTEMNRIYNAASVDVYSDAGIYRLKFDATLDGRTSEICRNMNGKIIRVEDLKPGVNMPPLHPWCRSILVVLPEDIELLKKSQPKNSKEDTEQALTKLDGSQMGEHAAALRSYGSFEAYALNAMLRGDETSMPAEYLKNIDSKIQDVMRKTYAPEAGTLYRASDFEALKSLTRTKTDEGAIKALKRYAEEGKTIKFKQYTSAYQDLESAEDHFEVSEGQKKVIIQIAYPKGQRMVDMSSFEVEKGMLLDKGQEAKVVSVEETEDKIQVYVKIGS